MRACVVRPQEERGGLVQGRPVVPPGVVPALNLWSLLERCLLLVSAFAPAVAQLRRLLVRAGASSLQPLSGWVLLPPLPSTRFSVAPGQPAGPPTNRELGCVGRRVPDTLCATTRRPH